MTDYWSDKTVFAHVGKLEVASVMYEVTADFSKALSHAFSLKVTLRGLGVQLGSTTVSPIADKPVSISIVQPIGGTLQGKITDWGATDSKGNPVPAHDTAWSDAAMVSFLITGTGNVALPVGDLLELVPGLGFLLKAAVSALGSTVSVNLGHKDVGLPIHRDASGKPIQPT